jgi:hypothetical protein
MNAIKMIGLAALAVLTATACVGVTSAQAIVPCSVDENPCAESHRITHTHGTSVGKSLLLTSIGTVECDVLALGDVVKTGSPLVLTGTATYSRCMLGGSSCTVTEENGPAESKVEKTGVETVKVTGEGLLHLVCGSSIDCSYNGVGLIATGKGPLISTEANGELTLSEQKTTKEAGGFLCPKESKTDIKATPLAAIYMSE